MANSKESQLVALARRQHGLFTTTDARSVGLSDHTIAWRLRDQRWLEFRPGVLMINGVPPSWEQAVMAAVLAAGDGAIASHATAATLWGLRTRDDRSIEILAPRPEQHRLTGVDAHRSVAILAEERSRVQGIPVTSPARTIVDLSARMSIGDAARMLDDAIRRDLTTAEQLARCVAGLLPAPGRRPALIRTLCSERIPAFDATESVLEMRVLRAIVGAGLPEPVPQFPVTVDGHDYRIDLAYPDSRGGLEVDGFRYHRERSDFDRDRRRANALAKAGWMLMRVTSTMADDEIVAAARALVHRTAA